MKLIYSLVLLIVAACCTNTAQAGWLRGQQQSCDGTSCQQQSRGLTLSLSVGRQVQPCAPQVVAAPPVVSAPACCSAPAVQKVQSVQTTTYTSSSNCSSSCQRQGLFARLKAKRGNGGCGCQ
jgi:hypothetical protein